MGLAAILVVVTYPTAELSLWYLFLEMLTDESKEHCRFKEEILMDSKNLSLLASAAQSTDAARQLIDCSLLRVLSQALTDFCLQELQQCVDANPRPGM